MSPRSLPTSAQLRSWQPETLASAASELRAEAREVRELADAAQRSLTSLRAFWRGAAADQAGLMVETLRLALFRCADALEVQADALTRFASTLMAAQSLLRAADSFAGLAHAELSPEHARAGVPLPPAHALDGSSHRSLGGFDPTSSAQVVAQRWAQAAQALAAEADARAANALDDDSILSRREEARSPMTTLVDGLRHLAVAMIGRPLGDGPLLSTLAWLSLPKDRPQPAPDEVARWWAALGPALRAEALGSDADRVGRLDGLPVSVRDKANRIVLAREIHALDAKIARLHNSDGLSGPLRHQAGQARGGATADAQRRRALLHTIRRALDDRNDRYLLLLDPRSPARVAIAVGDPDAAHHTAVLVPGMGTDVASDLPRLVHQAEALRSSSSDLLHATDPPGSGPPLATAPAALPGSGNGKAPIAVVAWLGYVAPGASQVIGSSYADRGAADLRRTLDGLSRSHVPGAPSHLTLVGHSYGSVVSGQAVRTSTPVHDLVLLGSPGIGARADQLAIPEGHVFVMETPDDKVADTSYFGVDPSSATFDGLLLESDGDPGRRLEASRGHSQYLDDGTESLANVAAVVVGRHDLTTVAER